MSDKDTTKPKEAVAKKEEEAADSDTEKDPSCPFSDDEIKRIQELLDEQFEREKEEAQFEGQIQCLWSGRYVPFCRCGPHLCCPEPHLSTVSIACTVDGVTRSLISPKAWILCSNAG